MRIRAAFSMVSIVALAACGTADAEPDVSTARETTPAAPSAERVYEMRTYTSHPGKLDDLLARFRNHTTSFFEKHGMVNEGYWVPTDPPLSENTLIYILSYPSREAAEASWAAFRSDPEWLAARAASEEAGPVNQSVVSVFLTPTDFSRMK